MKYQYGYIMFYFYGDSWEPEYRENENGIIQPLGKMLVANHWK